MLWLDLALAISDQKPFNIPEKLFLLLMKDSVPSYDGDIKTSLLDLQRNQIHFNNFQISTENIRFFFFSGKDKIIPSNKVVLLVGSYCCSNTVVSILEKIKEGGGGKITLSAVCMSLCLLNMFAC